MTTADQSVVLAVNFILARVRKADLHMLDECNRRYFFIVTPEEAAAPHLISEMFKLSARIKRANEIKLEHDKQNSFEMHLQDVDWEIGIVSWSADTDKQGTFEAF